MTKRLKPDSAGSTPVIPARSNPDRFMPVKGWSSGSTDSVVCRILHEKGLAQGLAPHLCLAQVISRLGCLAFHPCSCRVATCLAHTSNYSPASTSKVAEQIQIQAGQSNRIPGKRPGTVTSIHVAPLTLGKKQITPRLPLLFNSLPLPEPASHSSHPCVQFL